MYLIVLSRLTEQQNDELAAESAIGRSGFFLR